MTKTFREKYTELLHAMQSGVAQMQALDPSSTSAKHLRVGVNACMMDLGALTELLVEKGVITRPELEEKMLKYAEAEKRSYEVMLTQRLGISITLR